jgi:hypothetical protein
MAKITNFKISGDDRVITRVRISTDNRATWGTLYEGKLQRNLSLASCEVIDEMYGKVVVKFTLNYNNSDNLRLGSHMITISELPSYYNGSAVVTNIGYNTFTITYINYGYDDLNRGDTYINVNIPETNGYSSAYLNIPQPVTVLRGYEDPVVASLSATYTTAIGYSTVTITPPSNVYDMTNAYIYDSGSVSATITSRTSSKIVVKMLAPYDSIYPNYADYHLIVRVPATKEHPAIDYAGWIWIYGNSEGSGGSEGGSSGGDDVNTDRYAVYYAGSTPAPGGGYQLAKFDLYDDVGAYCNSVYKEVSLNGGYVTITSLSGAEWEFYIPAYYSNN